MAGFSDTYEAAILNLLLAALNGVTNAQAEAPIAAVTTASVGGVRGWNGRKVKEKRHKIEEDAENAKFMQMCQEALPYLVAAHYNSTTITYN